MALKQIFTLAMCLWLANTATVHAADTDAESKRLYKEGTKRYNLGEFEEAIKAYKSGYDAKADPVFLFNIAQAYRLWNKPDKAAFFYKSFLRNLPEAPNRSEVERRIAEMQTAIVGQKTSAAQPPPLSDAAPQLSAPPPAPMPMAAPPALPEQTDGTSLSQNAAESTGGPVYKQWWFWTALGAVALGTVAVIAVSSGGSKSPPKSDFPAVSVF